MPNKTPVFIVAAGFIFLSCQRDEITAIRVPKEPAAPLSGSMGGAMETSSAGLETPSSNHGLHWTAPKTWTEEPASQMRVGSFKASHGSDLVDISVVPLSGEAGGLAANLNRWRGQIQLPPLSDAEVKNAVRSIRPGNLPMSYAEFFNQGRGLVAAIYEKGAQTWFFKMTGPEAAVKSEKENFQSFLSHLHFHE